MSHCKVDIKDASRATQKIHKISTVEILDRLDQHVYLYNVSFNVQLGLKITVLSTYLYKGKSTDSFVVSATSQWSGLWYIREVISATFLPIREETLVGPAAQGSVCSLRSVVKPKCICSELNLSDLVTQNLKIHYSGSCFKLHVRNTDSYNPDCKKVGTL